MTSPVRVMVFYDGGYFKAGQIYFRYSEDRGWFSLPELHRTLEKYVASRAKSPVEVTKTVGAHYYDGRATTRAIEAEQLERERDFEMALISAGIVPHYLAVSEKMKPGAPEAEPEYVLQQKGVDVQLALDVLDFAHDDRFDVAVLAHFEIPEWKDQRGFVHRPTFASRALIDAVSWSLNFNQFVKDPNWRTEVKALFFLPKGKPAG